MGYEVAQFQNKTNYNSRGVKNVRNIRQREQITAV